MLWTSKKSFAGFFARKESAMLASAVLAAGILISKFMGFIRETIIAGFFGASSATDAYIVAYMFPGILFAMAGKALTTAFIPVFTELRTTGREDEAWETASNLLFLLGLLLVLVVVVMEVLAPWIVPFFAPGFDAATMRLATGLTRILLPGVIFAVMNGLYTGILNSYHMFSLTAMNGIIQNIGLIASLILLARVWGINALAAGALTGFVLQCVYLVPSVRKLGRFRLKSISFRNNGFRRVMTNMMPVVLGLSVQQVQIIIDRMMASGLPAGSVSALNFSNRLVSLPLLVFVSAVITALFPSLSAMAAVNDYDRLGQTLSRSLRTIWVVMVPMTVGMILLRVPLVGLAFQRGAFDLSATKATASAMTFYGLGLLGLASANLITRAFYALQNPKAPVAVSLLSIPVNILLNVVLIRPMGHNGLALGTSIAVTLQAAMLYVKMRRRLKAPILKDARSFAVKLAAASLVMGAVVMGTRVAVAQVRAFSVSVSYALQLFIPTLAGVGTFIAMVYVLDIGEAKALVARLVKMSLKIFRRGAQGAPAD